MSEPDWLVPSEGLPPEIAVQPANNNLAVTTHDGRTYLAWRTAPDHFASSEAVMYVASSDDLVTWTLETSVALGTDVREPQLLSWNGELWLYLAVLGESSTDFEPEGMRVSRREAPGEWTTPVSAYEPTFIPWRTKVIDDVPYLIGYTGGENVYETDGEPIDIHWLTTRDGTTWEAVVPGQPIVSTGGGSEADFVVRADGSLVSVIRNEAGDEMGYGSKICRATADDLGAWTCASDPRKYDSPLLFRNGADIWLVGRRNVTETGAYDLGAEDLDAQAEYLTYQLDYWQQPKRCSLWSVDPDTLTVTFGLDLPSAGDTCFPDVLDSADGSFEVFNYTSPLDAPDISWLEGQRGATDIYRVTLRFP
jgi:hypothetical protein